MRLSVRLAIALVFAAIVPLTIAGLLWLDLGRKALEEQVRATQLTAAERIAEGADQWLGSTLARMRLSGEIFHLHQMDDDARVGALRIVYWQLEEAPIVALYDDSGALVVPAVHQGDADVEDDRLPASREEVERFHRKVPLATILEGDEGIVVGAPYLDARRHAVMVPVAVRVDGGVMEPAWVLAAELSIRPLQELVGRLPHELTGTAYLVDEGGRILAHPAGTMLARRADSWDSIRALSELPGTVHTIENMSGERALAATAALQLVPWVAIVEQPEVKAFHVVRRLLHRTFAVLALSFSVALLIGVLLARGISSPIARASAGARAIAGGDLSGRVEERGPNEVREFAVAFNAMTSELRRSLEEIEAFNRELQARVTERTAELKKAQAELLQRRKMAAIGELGAGVAHELNNPMTGILGMAQLLLRKRDPDDPDARLLGRIEEDAKRCREIIMNLLRFSEQGEEVVLVEADLNEIASSAIALQLSLLQSKGLCVEENLARDLPRVRADSGQLQQAVLNLLSNASRATSEGGTIRVETGVEDPFVFLRILDTGSGIPKENLDRIFEPFFTTKEDWRGAGLGLSVAYRIVQSHNGTLDVDSSLGEGSSFTIRLPIPG